MDSICKQSVKYLVHRRHPFRVDESHRLIEESAKCIVITVAFQVEVAPILNLSWWRDCAWLCWVFAPPVRA
jgi:hypothetical protein